MTQIFAQIKRFNWLNKIIWSTPFVAVWIVGVGAGQKCSSQISLSFTFSTSSAIESVTVVGWRILFITCNYKQILEEFQSPQFKVSVDVVSEIHSVWVCIYLFSLPSPSECNTVRFFFLVFCLSS